MEENNNTGLDIFSAPPEMQEAIMTHANELLDTLLDIHVSYHLVFSHL